MVSVVLYGTGILYVTKPNYDDPRQVSLGMNLRAVELLRLQFRTSSSFQTIAERRESLLENKTSCFYWGA